MYSDADLSRISENDHLRSCHIRDLIHETAPPPIRQPSSRATIPQVLVQYWHDRDGIPVDVQACLESWTPLTAQGFSRLLFDDRQARRFIAQVLGQRYLAAFDRCYHPAMRCDYFRLCYILTHGGFYVDADELYQGTLYPGTQYPGAQCSPLFADDRLKVQPLCYDTVTARMVNAAAFVRDRQSADDWIFYVNNNPIIAPAHHPVIRLALERATRILLSGAQRPEIQSTTGPGNFTASLVRHSIATTIAGGNRDFWLLPNWEATSISPWTLSYRSDTRNWRLCNS